jgi:hypothetical protein
MFATTRTRFSVLGSFSLSNAANAFLWISFSPIFAATGSFWGVSATAVNALSLVFLVFYLPGALFASVLTERYGLRVTVVVGAALNLLGAALRAAGGAMPTPAGFGLALVGQTIAAIAQPIFTNSPARISADWFARSERDLATTAAALSNAVGNALGSALPPVFVSSSKDVPSFLLMQVVACAVIFVIQWVGMRTDAPPDPPSAAAAARRKARAAAGTLDSLPTTATESTIDRSLLDGAAPTQPRTLALAVRAVVNDYAALLASRNFCFLTVGFGLGLGLFNALLTLLAQVVAPCGYDADMAGNAGAALLGAGLVSAGVAGFVLEKTRAYVTCLRVLIVASIGAIVFFCASLRAGAPVMLLVSTGLMGAFVVPLLPVCLENAAEASFPTPEEVSSGMLIMVGNYVGIVLIYALQGALATPSSSSCNSVVTPSAAVLVGTLVLGAICFFFFRADYRRAAAERQDTDAQADAQ